MEGGAFAYSHLLGKTVWGHQAMAALISDGETALCYKLERCGKNDAGKIEQAAEIASSLPMAERLSYALMDSWYTCPKLINAFSAKGYHTIGALKTNRIIYDLLPGKGFWQAGSPARLSLHDWIPLRFCGIIATAGILRCFSSSRRMFSVSMATRSALLKALSAFG